MKRGSGGANRQKSSGLLAKQSTQPEPAGVLAGRGGAGSTPSRYKMREKLFDIGDDYWIETQHGRRAFKVDGKALTVRNTLVLESARGAPVYEIRGRLMTVRDTMAVSKPGGREVAVIRKMLATPLRDRMTANMADGPDIEIRGNIVSHEYTMERRGKRVAQVSKRWISVRDTYTVEIDPGEDDALILALTVVVEQMCH